MLFRDSLRVAILFGLVFVSACTNTSQGDPQPTDTTEASTTSSTPQASGSGEDELPFAGAPEVNDPLDTSRYEQDPCLSLTASQARSLTLPAAGTINDQVALGIGCEWKNPTTRGYVGIDFLVDDPRGLSPEYDANQRGRYAYFHELPDIEGYPAVARDGIDNRADGACSVLVGVADDMVFAVHVQLSQVNVDVEDPCEIAAHVAGLALQTMKKGE